ncbi:glycosyltransferase family 2 protein [Alloiococcus sp. CFN-8]|uniref:glycosyltransferase family 2 protein n=1 Tax=Alloiococcus sp. CFN-8 TaxID=3416081 RepID=UPI003CF42396
MVPLTVFTPTYNRAHTLVRTYKSLCLQNCKEFIWLIIDDGSTDNTKELVHSWQLQNSGFEILYIYKENGGMHTAHNTAYENITTELNVCIDSDDCLAEGAVEKILDFWNEHRSEEYAGIIGLDADFSGKIIGKGFPSEMKETTLSGYYASGGKGDKKLVYRTDVIKSYPPYPVFYGEKYIALAYKYTLIDQDYKLAVLDSVICNVEYQDSGSSATMWKQYLNNPKGFAFWRKVCMEYPMSRKRLFVDCVHYVSSSIFAGKKHFISESPQKCLSILAVPIGAVLTLYIKIKANNSSERFL